MTWQTSEGDRWLTGAEATLVRETLALMIDQISDNIEDGDEERLWDFGVELFDELTGTQQLVIAKTVAEHLLVKTTRTLELTSINEATVYAVFRTLTAQIEIEVDTENDKSESDPWRCYWRRLTLNAFKECFPHDEADGFEGDDPEDPWMTPQSEASSNVPQWDSLTESLADRILWDRDFEMAGSFLDDDPAQAAVMKQMMGISADYYSDVAPDLKTDQVQAMLRDVRQLTHRKPR
jgi:hypothetical protein